MKVALFAVGLLITCFAGAQQPEEMPSAQSEAKNNQQQPAGVSEASQPAGNKLQVTAPVDTFKRDPFRLPLYLIEKLTYKAPPPVVEQVVTSQVIDDQIDPLQRWPSVNYVLVGIIWDVKKPKALLKDPQSRVHIVKINDRVGSKAGVVSSIKEGTMIVSENGVPLVLKLKK